MSRYYQTKTNTYGTSLFILEDYLDGEGRVTSANLEKLEVFSEVQNKFIEVDVNDLIEISQDKYLATLEEEIKCQR